MFRSIPLTRGRQALGVFFMVSSIVNLSGCATHPIEEPTLSWKARQQTLIYLDHWSFSGRLAVKDKEQQSWSASLRWQQQGNSYDIHLSGAFGQGAARLFGHEGYAVIETTEQAALTASSAELLMQEQLGWSVPVQGLKYWLIGSPEPGMAEHLAFDAFGRLSELEQSGWQIRYSSYTRVEGIDLPRKLELENPRLRVRLVIDAWQLEHEVPA